MNKVYFISGLGADKRVFSFLNLSFCEPVFIEWITPLKKESLKSYASRLRSFITGPNPVIVGISFGGMLVTEMAKADKNIKAIIISSNKTTSEFPWYLKIGKYLPAYKIIPSSILKKLMMATRWLLGAKSEEQKRVLRNIINDTDIRFTKWAINAILNWKNKQVPENLIHIHGTADKLLRYRFVKPNYTIIDGTHIMPMDKHEELSKLLYKLTQKE